MKCLLFALMHQNPDIVLVHYLNVPYPDDAKLLVVASVSLWAERKEWSKEELISQLRPMCKRVFVHCLHAELTGLSSLQSSARTSRI